jgi:hypothetical protein
MACQTRPFTTEYNESDESHAACGLRWAGLCLLRRAIFLDKLLEDADPVSQRNHVREPEVAGQIQPSRRIKHKRGHVMSHETGARLTR